MNKTQKTLLSLMTISAMGMSIKDALAAPRTLLTHQSQSELSQRAQKNTAITSIEIYGNGNFPVDIPDNDPAGINIEIDATNFFTGPIESLTFELEIEHAWAGDISATLIAPNGIAQLVLFSRVGRTPDNNNGFSSDLSGNYGFNDQATQDFWQAASNAGIINPTNQYRTSTAGTNLSRFGGCSTRLNGAFKGLTPQQTNGIWTLNISDNDPTVTGQVLSVGLLADQDNSNQDTIFKSGFDREFVPLQFLPASNVLGNCKKAQFDLTGNGLSDYVTSWPGNEGLTDLFIQTVANDGTSTPSQDSNFNTNLPFSNTVVTSGGDFDGDGITDLAFQVRKDAPDEGFDYMIRRSSRPDDLWILDRTDTTLYDPQFGDYDGDGLDDLAWYFAPENSSGDSFAIIVNSSDLVQRSFSVGNTTREMSRAAGGFDHTGDGIADFVASFHVGELMGDGLGNQFVVVFDGSTGDFVISSGIDIWTEATRHLPGYFLNSVQHSTAGIGAFVPTEANQYNFFIEDDTQENFPTLSTTLFGHSPTDIPVTGDYDGDGVDDFGVWRPFSSSFLIRPSGSNDPDNNIIEVSPFEAQSLDNPIGDARVR